MNPQTGVDAGGGINGYKQRSCEYIVSLSDTFTLEGCLAYLKMGIPINLWSGHYENADCKQEMKLHSISKSEILIVLYEKSENSSPQFVSQFRVDTFKISSTQYFAIQPLVQGHTKSKSYKKIIINYVNSPPCEWSINVI